ncbi:MAG: glycosyltransferase involved in cell wall biosynthesis [Psychroserpens sp.]|jgi:glycosyltransferase involved in cell wall biosynthesis
MNKIIFVLESFFPTHRAGTEVYVLNLCSYFKLKGWVVQVLVATTQKQKDYVFQDIPVFTFPVPVQATPQELNGLVVPRGIEEFTEVLEAIQPGWVHFHSFGRAINTFHFQRAKELGFKTAFTPHLGGNFCIKGNLRLFEQHNCDGKVDENRCTACFIHSKGINISLSKVVGKGIVMLTKQNPLKKALPPAWFQANHRKQELRRIAQYTDVIFSIAPWIQKAFQANGIENSIYLPQGISPLFFLGERNQHKPIQKTIHFLFLGRMHPIKGFHFLKQAWEELEGNQYIRLHILTNPSGDEMGYFGTQKSWAVKQANITWKEGFSQQEVADYLNDMDVLVLPSISEVAPLVILEAATRKIPTIASDYIAMKESVVHDVNGWLFENGNTAALKILLQEIIDHPEKIMKVSQNISKPYCINQVATIIEERLLLV